MIEDNVNSIFEKFPVQLGLKVQSPNLYINGIYKTPTFGLAVFKQMTYNNLFIKNLSGTIGLRLDYEHTKINHHTFIDKPFIRLQYYPSPAKGSNFDSCIRTFICRRKGQNEYMGTFTEI